MLRIRLTRVGKKNSPAYRVVVADHRRAVKRKFIEILGHYNPTTNPKELVIDKEKSLHWISQGAQPSDTVNNLMCDLGILNKKDKVKKVYGKATKKKDEGKKTEETAAPAAAEKTADEKVETPTEESVEEAPVETPAEETPEKEPATKETPVEETVEEK